MKIGAAGKPETLHFPSHLRRGGKSGQFAAACPKWSVTPYGAFSKFPAGWSAPLHTHPSDHKLVVISGTWIHGEPGKPDVKLGPGSYLFQPAGKKHTSACDAASECVGFLESNGKFGIKFVEEKKAPAKPAK